MWEIKSKILVNLFAATWNVQVNSSLTFVSGPENWPQNFPLANGVRQSPVNITTSTTTTSTDLSANPLRWTYVPENSKCLINPGYCWRVDIKGEGSELTGGPLNNDIYRVEQFHCHWGCSDARGSEHTVDGQAFSGELHIVHWNSTKYGSFHEAAGHPDGLAVLGCFLKVNDRMLGRFVWRISWIVPSYEFFEPLQTPQYQSLQVGKQHDELDQIARLMPFITHKGDRVSISYLCAINTWLNNIENNSSGYN